MVAWTREVAEGFQRSNVVGCNYIGRVNRTCRWIRCKGPSSISASYVSVATSQSGVLQGQKEILYVTCLAQCLVRALQIVALTLDVLRRRTPAKSSGEGS